MFTSTHMGLDIWDLSGDAYDHVQLASNFEILDLHDHSSGRGVQIPSGGIANAAIGTTQIAAGGVATGNIANGAITNPLIATGAVQSGSIADGQIHLNHLGSDVTLFPAGSMVAYGGSAAPSGFVLCDGSVYAIGAIGSTYHALSVALGTAYNTGGEGGGNFRVPDLRTRIPLGKGTVSASASLGLSEALAVGSRFVTHAHTQSSHSHVTNAHGHSVGAHLHGIFGDGSHTHTWEGGNFIHTRQNAFLQGLAFKDTGNVTRQNTLQSLYVAGFNEGGGDIGALMDPSVTHDHSGATANSAPFNTGAQTDAGTDAQAPAISLSAAFPYLVLNWIIKL